jgi:hypothetical protein
MTEPFRKKEIYCRGLSLVEAMVYISLLAILLTACMNYLYGVHFQNIDLIHDVEASYESSYR